MKEVIYYRCEYCDKDFADKATGQRHEKAEIKKHNNIETLLSLRRRNLKDENLYMKFFNGNMEDTSFTLCPGDLLTHHALTKETQKCLASCAKKLPEYEKDNHDTTFKLTNIFYRRGDITFVFVGKMVTLEGYVNSFKKNTECGFSLSYENGEKLKVNFVSSSDALNEKLLKKIYKLVAETKLVYDGSAYYEFNFESKLVISHTKPPGWPHSNPIKERKFESL